MSTPTPPGWYPVPGTGQERWWDGTAWTDSHRPAGRINDAVTQSWEIAPGPQPQPYDARPAARSGRGRVVAATGALAVLVVGAIATAVWALGPDHGKNPSPAPTLTVAVSSPAASGPRHSTAPPPTPSPADSSDDSPGPGPGLSVADQVHGWGVPLPDGWTAEPATDRASLLEISGQYACSQSEQLCVRGQFAIAAEPVDAADARTAAEQEMAAFAPSIFGDLRSHREEAAGTLTVAGRQGWAIRWYVEPREGASGYVLVATVPASGGGYVILHGGVDDDPKAPDASVLDDIVAGITAAS